MSYLPLFASSPIFPLTSQTPTTLGARWTFGTRWTITLRRSPTEWRFHADSHSYRLWAQNGWVQKHRLRSNQSWRPRVQKNWVRQKPCIKSTKDLWEVLLLEILRNLEQLVPMSLTSSHRCIPITIQRKALQTRTLKMENYEKCWRHRCIFRIEKTMNPLECQSQRWNLLHCYRREEQVRKSAHADFRKGLMSSSSQEPSAPGKPAALFSFGSEEPIQEFCFQTRWPVKCGKISFWGNKDLLLSKAKSELMKQEHQVGSLNDCVSELEQQA